MKKYDFKSVQMLRNRFDTWDIIVATTLLTRIPMPQAPARAYQRQAQSVWFFPFIGAILGIFGCVLAALSMKLGFSTGVSAGFMLVLGFVLTGGMHEDGLADCADGFWGGFDVQKRLEIMKDSQIGTYGVLALISVIGLRWMGIGAHLEEGFYCIIAAMALSRGVLPLLMAWQNNARNAGLSSSVGRVEKPRAVMTASLALILALCLIQTAALSAMAVGLLTCTLTGFLAQHKIKGQTGDVLGAAQVLSETAILLWLIS